MNRLPECLSDKASEGGEGEDRKDGRQSDRDADQKRSVGDFNNRLMANLLSDQSGKGLYLGLTREKRENRHNGVKDGEEVAAAASD